MLPPIFASLPATSPSSQVPDVQQDASIGKPAQEFVTPDNLVGGFRKARSPEKFMDVSDVNVSDEDGYLSRSMTINANNKIVKERIWINRVASEIVFQLLHPDTGAP